MAISAVLWQFGFGGVCVFLRFSEQPFFRCLRRCGKCFRRCGGCIWRCLACFCACCGARSPFSTASAPFAMRCCSSCKGPCAAVFAPLLWVCSHVKLRWYWLLLANNVGFMVREFAVISLLDGWSLELVIADVAIWLTLLMVLWEVWRFSTVRHRAPKTVDQVLDMLLLPLNYGMFCALCVRILKLQHSDENQEMVAAVIDSADIWESWALWSVLELFVLVVENAAKRDPLRVNDAEYLVTIRAFKSLSLHGVKAFFVILFCFCSLDIFAKGVVAPTAPTFCYWFYEHCMSCSDWYHLHINPVAQSIIYIMCSFALIFVFTFERMFSDYLHCIQPYWKFWGVKLVVSVTYFQWLVISYCFGLSSREVYLWHCLLCCIEMPLLAFLHATCAYPYGKAWLDRLLDHVPAETSEHAEEPAEVGELDPEEPSGDAEAPAIDQPPITLAAFASQAASDEAASSAEVAMVATQDGEVSQEEPAEPRKCYSYILYLLIWIGLCYGATKLVFTVIPPSYDLRNPEPAYNFMCNSQDLGHYVEKQSDLHWLLPSHGDGQLRIPGTAGVWLPLCGSTLVDCTIGYQGNPTISCSADGKYSVQGKCQEVVCGPPLELPHAAAQYDHRAWTSGMKVKYLCDKGFRGSPVATCGKDGNYTVQGACEEIVCGTPPPVPHSSSPQEPDDGKWKEGMEARYQCDTGYRGKPVGLCGEDEVWTVNGHCQVMCGTPPVLPHAIPQFDRNTQDISIGSRLKYECAAGYGGHPVAVCDVTGKYRIEDSCEVVCGLPLEISHGIARIDVNQAKRGFKVGARITYWCDAGYGGDPVTQCEGNGHWKFETVDSCVYLGCGSLDDFLTKNVSRTWEDAMVVKEKLNFTSSDYGDVVFFSCNPGYSGSPLATCLHGNWQMSGRTCVVACGSPPLIDHSLRSFNVTKAQHGWTVGMRVIYKCQLGYGGNPVAECSPDGAWKFGGTEECVDYGCGSLQTFLESVNTNWRDVMRVEEMINFTSSDYGDVVFFRCQPGYVGKPLATCATGSWRLTDTCTPSATSFGCTCETDWTYCKGWLGTNCQRWHGCTVRALGDPYGWCDVKLGSCPEGAGLLWGQAPTWDYCAQGSSNFTWMPEKEADVGPPTQVRLLFFALLGVGAAVSGFYLYRAAKAYRHRHRLQNELDQEHIESRSFMSSRASGLSLPELRGPDDTSSENSSPEQLIQPPRGGASE